MSWHLLSVELQLMVLNETLASQGEQKLSPLATVCNGWREFFEPIFFHRIVLTKSHINKFKKIVRVERRRLVKHIWLQVELPPDNPSPRENNRALTNSVWLFMEALKGWWSNEGKGITLELSIHSPSDSTKLSFGHQSGQLLYPHLEDECCSYREYTSRMDAEILRNENRDPYWGRNLSNGFPGVERIRSSRQRALGGPLHLDFSDFAPRKTRKLPSCPVVDKFLVRRQHGYQLHPKTLASILEKLPNVEQILYEPWNKAITMSEPEYICRMRNYLNSAGSLKRLSLFENYRNIFHPYVPRAFPNHWDTLGFVLATSCSYLEHLSVAYATDAEFVLASLYLGDLKSQETLPDHVPGMILPLLSPRLQNKWKDMDDQERESRVRTFLDREFSTKSGEVAAEGKFSPEWTTLKSLALTSYCLQERRPSDEINNLLHLAAKAAKKMPNLLTMEIWNDYEQGMCVFRYKRAGKNGSPTIYLTSTWKHNLSERVIDIWKTVAEQHVIQKPLEVVIERLTKHLYLKFGSGIHLLELRDQILHQVSASEIDWNSRQKF